MTMMRAGAVVATIAVPGYMAARELSDSKPAPADERKIWVKAGLATAATIGLGSMLRGTRAHALGNTLTLFGSAAATGAVGGAALGWFKLREEAGPENKQPKRRTRKRTPDHGSGGTGPADVERKPAEKAKGSSKAKESASRPKAGWRGPGTYEVLAENVYLRTHPSGLVRGTLFEGDRMYIQFLSPKGWAWGHAYGHADKPGWLMFSRHNPLLGKVASDAPPKGLPPRTDLSRGIDFRDGAERDREGHDRWTDPATIRRSSAKMYANYSPETGPTDPIPGVDPQRGDPIGVRYRYDDEWVVVFRGNSNDEDPSPHWGFMRRDDIEGA